MNSNYVEKIFINKINGMERKVIGETTTYVITIYKGCIPMLVEKLRFLDEHELLLEGKGRCSFQDYSPPPPKGVTR